MTCDLIGETRRQGDPNTPVFFCPAQPLESRTYFLTKDDVDCNPIIPCQAKVSAVVGKLINSNYLQRGAQRGEKARQRFLHSARKK